MGAEQVSKSQHPIRLVSICMRFSNFIWTISSIWLIYIWNQQIKVDFPVQLEISNELRRMCWHTVVTLTLNCAFFFKGTTHHKSGTVLSYLIYICLLILRANAVKCVGIATQQMVRSSAQAVIGIFTVHAWHEANWLQSVLGPVPFATSWTHLNRLTSKAITFLYLEMNFAWSKHQINNDWNFSIEKLIWRRCPFWSMD